MVKKKANFKLSNNKLLNALLWSDYVPEKQTELKYFNDYSENLLDVEDEDVYSNIDDYSNIEEYGINERNYLLEYGINERNYLLEYNMSEYSNTPSHSNDLMLYNDSNYFDEYIQTSLHIYYDYINEFGKNSEKLFGILRILIETLYEGKTLKNNTINDMYEIVDNNKPIEITKVDIIYLLHEIVIESMNLIILEMKKNNIQSIESFTNQKNIYGFIDFCLIILRQICNKYLSYDIFNVGYPYFSLLKPTNFYYHTILTYLYEHPDNIMIINIKINNKDMYGELLKFFFRTAKHKYPYIYNMYFYIILQDMFINNKLTNDITLSYKFKDNINNIYNKEVLNIINVINNNFKNKSLINGIKEIYNLFKEIAFDDEDFI